MAISARNHPPISYRRKICNMSIAIPVEAIFTGGKLGFKNAYSFSGIFTAKITTSNSRGFSPTGFGEKNLSMSSS
jgi:hypothetical protein